MSTCASFQGRVSLGKRDALGNPVEVRSPGNVAELKLSLKTDVLKRLDVERLVAGRIPRLSTSIEKQIRTLD